MKNNVLFQHGTLGGLMSGLMEGTMSVAEVSEHGTLGLGTLEDSNGELIYLDEDVFHVDETGKVTKLKGDEMTPYSAIAPFKVDYQFAIDDQEEESYKAILSQQLKSKNLFHAVKIKGTFKKMHVRVAPKQHKPYPRFVEIVNHQPEFFAEEVEGTIVGFYAPELFQGIDAAGYHLHFISSDQQFGGHVLGFSASKTSVGLGVVPQLVQDFPVENQSFLDNEIDPTNLSADITKAE